jgi:hypothetical protein
MLFGTSIDGPVLTPVPIKDYMHAENIFGSPNYGTLVRGAFQALKAGASEVVLMRISGSHARGVLYGLTDQDVVVPALELKSVFGGDVYNNLSIRITTKEIIFDLADVRGKKPVTYAFRDYPTIGLLSDAINQDCEHGKNLVYTDTEHRLLPSATLRLVNDGEVFLSGGQDGLNLTKNDIYLQLEEAYQNIDDYPVEFLVPLGVYLDDTYPHAYYGITPYAEGWYSKPTVLDENTWLTLVEADGTPCNFATQLIRVCEHRLSRGYPGIGIIGMKPVRESDDNLRNGDLSHIGKLISHPIVRYGFRRHDGGEIFENGYLVSLVASEVLSSYGEYSYQDNGAAAYAALLSQLPVGTSSTNKTLEGIELPYKFTSEELEKLNDLGYVTFHQSVRHGIVPTAGITLGSKNSGLRFVSSVRVLQSIISEIQMVTDTLIGEPIPSDYDFLEAQVEDILSRHQKAQSIRDYRYTFEQDVITGTLILRLDIWLIHEVSSVSSVLRFSLY